MNVRVEFGFVLDTTSISVIALSSGTCNNLCTPKNDLVETLCPRNHNEGVVEATSASGRRPYLQDWMFQEERSVDAVVRRQHCLSYESGHTLIGFRRSIGCCSRGGRGIATIIGSCLAALLLGAATAVALRWGAATIAGVLNSTTTAVGCAGACKRLGCAVGLSRALPGRQAVGRAAAYPGLVPGDTIPGLQLFAWQLAGRHVEA